MQAVNFNLIISILILMPLGIFAGCGLVYVFNHMPYSWLCEYGEEKPEESDCQRLCGIPWKAALSCFFMVTGIYMVTLGGHDIVFAIPTLVCVWLLMIIAISDGKYMIIPDQFVLFLLLMAIAFLPFGFSLRSLLLGAAAGAGLMLVVAIAGYFVSGREALGFGDVKLMLAVGAVTGFETCIGIMVVASILSGLAFFIGLLRKKYTAKSLAPLGPYLAGVTIAALVLL